MADDAEQDNDWQFWQNDEQLRWMCLCQAVCSFDPNEPADTADMTRRASLFYGFVKSNEHKEPAKLTAVKNA